MTDRELMQMVLDAYESKMQQIGGCSDGGCVVVKPTGMHTNGGCKCWKNQHSMQRLARAANSLAKALRATLAQPEQEPVAWMHIQGNHEDPCFRELTEDEISRGWTQKPLYTAPPQRDDECCNHNCNQGRDCPERK